MSPYIPPHLFCIGRGSYHHPREPVGSVILRSLNQGWGPPYEEGTMPLLPPEIVLEVFVHVKHQGFFSGDIARARQKMLYSFCLVSHQWNRTFTPLLYVDVTLDDHNAGMELPTLLLRRTLWHTHPARKDLIERMQVFSSRKSPSTLWMVVLSNLPNLRELMIHQFDHSQFHPKLAQHIRSLSKRCTILPNPASRY